MGFSGMKLLKGTFLLTIAGFLTRILGFFYRIYLADLLGAELLGVYQLIFPVYAICFTIYGAGIQTAISQVVAADVGRNGETKSSLRLFAVGSGLALSLALVLSVLVYTQAEWIALHFVMEPSLTPYLKILSFLFPFCCITDCINGYYYGIQEAKVPAITQLIEQFVRISFVFGVSFLFAQNTSPQTSCRLAAWGLVAGEAASCFYNLAKLWKHCRGRLPVSSNVSSSVSSTASGIQTLFRLSFTLTLTRLLITVLNSMESVLLPSMLRKYGCSPQDALSIYGILTGMCFSFLFFPSTITNSFAVMLVPSIADAHAGKNVSLIRKSIVLSIKYCVLLGLLCTCIFLVFGREMGLLFFHNEDAGNYLVTLAWLCPFLYLGTTLTSIINGLEKTGVTFFITLGSLAVKIGTLLFAVPIWGIRAYLIGLLVSQLVQVVPELLYLSPYLFYTTSKTESEESSFCPVRWILLPSLFLLGGGIAAKNSYLWLGSCLENQYPILSLGITGGCLCILYIVFLCVTKTLRLPVTSLPASPLGKSRRR